MFQKNQWCIFVDDMVQVVTGAESGATGRVLAVIKDKKQPEVIVEGVNMVRLHAHKLMMPDCMRKCMPHAASASHQLCCSLPSEEEEGILRSQAR